MKAHDVVVQPCSTIHELLVHNFAANGNGVAHLIQCVCYLLHDLLRRKVGTVKIDGKVAEADFIQPAKNDLKGRAFFRHE